MCCYSAVVNTSLGLSDLETGFFALHIHEGGNFCGSGFSNTDGHYNPEGAAHPRHVGDLPPLLSDKGKAYSQVLTGRFRVSDIIGRTVVIHRDPDDFKTQPCGNAWQKNASAVIRWA